MNDPDRPKPLPARPPTPPPSNGTPPAAEAAPSDTIAAPEPSVGEPPETVEIAWRGAVWTARVVGRAGRAEARAAPLMLVGFRKLGSEAGDPGVEATIPGRRLTDLTEDALLAALDQAKAPPTPGLKRPFFEDSDPTRRSGAASEY
jgi:hypothetical protein